MAPGQIRQTPRTRHYLRYPCWVALGRSLSLSELLWSHWQRKVAPDLGVKTRDNVQFATQRILAASIRGQRVRAQKGPLALKFELDLLVSLRCSWQLQSKQRKVPFSFPLCAGGYGLFRCPLISGHIIEVGIRASSLKQALGGPWPWRTVDLDLMRALESEPPPLKCS